MVDDEKVSHRSLLKVTYQGHYKTYQEQKDLEKAKKNIIMKTKHAHTQYMDSLTATYINI